ncbi:hypothetical protein ABT282_08590 [Streptomyces sp. NPDC000927]|uniref:hypothetical protein n=1 Tax=Streptomyces sp. NPDC000927 TaxID=3154371 RepID=UPI003317516F
MMNSSGWGKVSSAEGAEMTAEALLDAAEDLLMEPGQEIILCDEFLTGLSVEFDNKPDLYTGHPVFTRSVTVKPVEAAS